VRQEPIGIATSSWAPVADERPSVTSGSGYVGFALLAVLALVVILFGHVALDRGWLDLDRPTAFLARGFAAATALGIGLVNLSRFMGRRDAASLIVGVAFTGVGVIYVARTVFHVLAVIVDPAYFDMGFRLNWAQQMLLPVALLLGIVLVPPSAVGGRSGPGSRDRVFAAAVGVLVLGTLVGAWHPAFPGYPLEGTLVARPHAGWIVAVYLVLLVQMWRRPDLTGTPEGHWLAFALYIGFLQAALILPFWHSVGIAAAILDTSATMFMLFVAGTGTLIGMVRQARSEVDLLDALRHESQERSRVEAALARQAARLEQTNEELSQYAYLASHDLQEPLRMVTNYLQLIERRYDHVLDDDGREFMHFAVDGAVRMKRLTNDLLAYSQVSAQRLGNEATDAGAAFATACKNLEVAIQEAQAEVTADELPSVPMDTGRLVQLFQNLIANALKFRVPGMPARVHASAAREGAFWRFTVRDHGIGIESAHHDKIFGVFQRLHRQDVYPGSGIGLAICRKIVEQHGGAIWVTSPPEGGTAFHWTVPVDPERARPQASSAESEDAELISRVTTLIERAKELI
jgi:signal transduction histidine kinase